MKPKRSNPLFASYFHTGQIVPALVIVALCGLCASAQSQTLYWDNNGATAGLGSGGGAWDAVTPNWSTSLDGDVPTVVWADGSTARFQNTGDYTVTLDGVVAAPQIRFAASGAQTLTGGTINITPSSGLVLNTAAAGNASGNTKTIASSITGTGGLSLALNGDLSAGGGGSNTYVSFSSATSDFTGNITVTSGLLSWTNDGALGNAANNIILDGGGTLDPNLSRTTSRNIQVTSNGGTIRTWGSATSTISGVVSGVGNINRTDGGVLVLTNPANSHSGSWTLQGGRLRLGGGGSLGTASVVNNTTLEFMNDATAATFSNPVSGSGLTSFESTAGTTYGGTMNSTGTLYVGDVTNNALLTINNGANITVNNLSLGESTSVAGIVSQQSGSSVTVNNDFRVGHWSTETSIYNVSGGSLSILGTPAVGNTNFETPGVIILGVDGTGIFNQTGGTVTAAGLGLDTRSDTAGTDQYNLNGGTLTIGSKGIGGFASSELNFGGGTLKPSADFTSTQKWNVNSTSVIDLDDWYITHTASILGNGALTLTDSSLNAGGKLIFNGAAQTISAGLAGAVPVEYAGTGTLTLSGASTHTGTFDLLGGTLNMTGSTASDVILAGGTTLRGEGSITGGLTALGTLNLPFDPATEPAALAVSGGLTLNDVVTLSFVSSPPVTSNPITVLTYDSLSGTGSFVLPDNTSYRSSTINAGATALTLDIDTKAQTWTGGTVWDTGTTGVWNDGVIPTDTFYWGDHVLFDDTATTTTVTLTGNLQPGLITVNSNTNNFTFNGSAGNAISGIASLLKSGSSTLTINGPNTYSGGTVLSQGSIVITGVNNGLGTGAITLGDSNTGNSNISLLLTNGRGLNNAINLTNNGTGTATLGFSGTGGSYTEFSGPITIARDLTILAGTTDRLHFGNSISGSGNVTVTGGQRVTMSGTNSFSGSLVLSGAGTVFQTFGGNPIPDASTVDVGIGATFQVYTSETIGALTGTGKIWPIAGKPNLTVGGNNSSGTFSGTWTNNVSDHLNITKAGTGTQTISGTVTSPGAATVNGGALVLTSSASFDRTFAPGTALPNRAVQGSGTFKADAGSNVTLRRSSAGFTGTVQVATGGTLTVGHADASGSAAGSLALQGGTLAFDNSGSFFTPLSGSILTGGTLTTDVTTRNYGTLHNTSGDVAPGSTTHVYHGKIYLPAGQWSFAKSFDDGGSVTIGGTTIINDGTWNATATGSFTANSAGWFDFNVRVYQGGGGVGPVNSWTKGIGIKQGAPTTVNADYLALTDENAATLGARLAIGNDLTFPRPINVANASTITTSAMVGTPGSAGIDGNGNNGDVTLSSGITGSADLVKTGTGTLILGASNSFSGNLVVDGGGLRINASVGSVASFTVNAGAVLESNATNIFVGGHGIPMADTRVIAVNGGTWIITGSHDARFGNVSLSNGATWTSNRGLGGYDALLANTSAGAATVAVANSGGNTSPSIMNGSGGIHLQGIQNFNVADVTGTPAADLLVNMILGAQGTTGGDAGGVRKIGAGTMTVTAANTYTGGTIVEAGTLLVNNAAGSGTGTGSVVVNTGATLGGTGAISGSLTVENGGTLSPGASIESLDTGDLLLSSSSTVEMEIDSSGTPSVDTINVNGTATIAGSLSVSDIAGTPASLPGGTKLTLITYSVGLSGEFTGRPEGSEFTLGPNTYIIRYQDSNAVTLEVKAGGYDDWAGQITNGENLRTQDADDDGFTNLQEFLFGTDPMAADGALTTVEKSGADLIIRWNERASGATYRLLESATLTNPWTESGEIPFSEGPEVGGYIPRRADVTIGAGKNFFRIEGVEN